MAMTLSSLGDNTETTLLGGNTSEYESDDGGLSIVVLVFSHDNYTESYLRLYTVLSYAMSMRSENSVSSIRGVGPELADRLSAELDIETIDDLDDCDPADLVCLDGVGMTTFARLVAGEPERRL
jgi:hypothetical protein